jgi:coenzyme F420-reducing hydrogenase alpha subunit
VKHPVVWPAPDPALRRHHRQQPVEIAAFAEENAKRLIEQRRRLILADKLDPHRYHTFLGEASEEFSFMKFPYYKPMGYPGGAYRVGRWRG